MGWGSTGGTVWDLLLALAPVPLGWLLGRCLLAPAGAARWLIVPTVVLWLVFLPNCCYLLTKWRYFVATPEHYGVLSFAKNDREAARAIVSLAGACLFQSGFGILAFTLAVRPVARVPLLRGARGALLAVPFFLLMAVGVLLGLRFRFNSWDLLYRPAAILESLAASLTPAAAGIAAVFWLLYLVTDIWIDGLILRWSQLRRGQAP